MVSEEVVCKFGDFGVSKLICTDDVRMKFAEGTRMFHAPETLYSTEIQPFPLDVWALGVTFYYLLMDEYPFFNFDSKIMRNAILTEQ